MALSVKQIPCGSTEDEVVCACGCSGYDDRCAYWSYSYDQGREVDPSHRCCKTNKTHITGTCNHGNT